MPTFEEPRQALHNGRYQILAVGGTMLWYAVCRGGAVSGSYAW